MKVLKIILIFILGITCLSDTNAQTFDRLSFEKKQLSIQAGIGIIPLGINRGKMLGQPTFIADYGFSKKASIGVFAIPNYQTTELDRRNSSLSNNTKTIVGTRILGHVSKYKNWDVYGGFQIGYIHSTTNNQLLIDEELDIVASVKKAPKVYTDKMVYSPVIGWKFQPVKKNIGAFIEMGFNGTAFGTIGLSYRK